MLKVDNRGWILVNDRILNLALIEQIRLIENEKQNSKNKNYIIITFNSGENCFFYYEEERIALQEFNLIKKAMGFE